MELVASPVKESAIRLELPVLQPATIKNNDSFRSRLAELRPDAIIVVGYGRIIPQWMIEAPRFGNLNLHASLLPKYRGAAPIQWAIANGESVTGVTAMRIDAGLDTGDILMQRDVAILPNDTAETLAPRLATIGAELMVKTLGALENGEVRPTPQNDSRSSLAPILTKEDGRMDFARSATELFNRMRGFRPWPGAFTTYKAKTLQVHRVEPLLASADLGLENLRVPGTFSGTLPGTLAVDGARLVVGCGQGSALDLLELQLEGKRRMTAQEFINGYRPKSGDVLGEDRSR